LIAANQRWHLGPAGLAESYHVEGAVQMQRLDLCIIQVKVKW